MTTQPIAREIRGVDLPRFGLDRTGHFVTLLEGTDEEPVPVTDSLRLRVYRPTDEVSPRGELVRRTYRPLPE